MKGTVSTDKIDDAENKKFLLDLAIMEDEHEQIFIKMRSELTRDEKVMTTFDPEGESEAYLKSLADTRVFYEKEIDTNSLKEIFKNAITTEKDSIARITP